jgi:hypothetical protein
MSQGFELLEVALNEVDQLALDLRFLLERANLFGEIGLSTADEIARLALLLFDLITPRSLKDLLRRLPEGSLVTLRLDESLQHIPWEFMHTGRDFLSRQLSIGRVVARYGIEPPPARRDLSAGIRRALIIADPRADLHSTAAEGLSLCDLLRSADRLEVAYKAYPVSRADVREQLREHDLLHFAGHVERDVRGAGSGWALSDGLFGAADIDQLAGGRLMPALVFINGCASAAAHGALDHMARSLLSAGAVNVIGTLWDLPDALGAVFAHSLYDDLLHGVPIGEALRRARIELAYHHGEGAMLWGSYILYGPPEQRYFTPSNLADAPPPGLPGLPGLSGLSAPEPDPLTDPLFALPDLSKPHITPTANLTSLAVRRAPAALAMTPPHALTGALGLGVRAARAARAAAWGLAACALLMAASLAALWAAQPQRLPPLTPKAAPQPQALASAPPEIAPLAATPPPSPPSPPQHLNAPPPDAVSEARLGAGLGLVVAPSMRAYAVLPYLWHHALVQALPLPDGPRALPLAAFKAYLAHLRMTAQAATPADLTPSP